MDLALDDNEVSTMAEQAKRFRNAIGLTLRTLVNPLVLALPSVDALSRSYCLDRQIGIPSSVPPFERKRRALLKAHGETLQHSGVMDAIVVKWGGIYSLSTTDSQIGRYPKIHS